MNGIGGIEFASRLRRHATRPTVIVALTGVGTNDELVPVRAGAFDSVLLKPVDPDDLVRVLNAHAAVANGRNGMSPPLCSAPAPGALSP